MIKCNSCGRDNEDHYKFCLGCGASLADAAAIADAGKPAWPSNCPSCKEPLSDGQRFCGACGFNVGTWISEQSEVKPAKAPSSAAPSSAAQPKAPPATSSPAAPAKAPKPAQASEAPAKLILLNADGSEGGQIPLSSGENVLGRSSDSPLMQRDAYLSPKHIRLTFAKGSVKASDEGGPNGVFIRITKPRVLQHGDEIRVGRERLRYEELDSVKPYFGADPKGVRLLGSPLRGAWGRLQRISGPAESSIAFLLREPEHGLGREVGDIVFPDDGYVSGKHARIFRNEKGEAVLEDLRSSNGTFIRIREAVDLPTNSLLLLGEQPFRLVYGD